MLPFSGYVCSLNLVHYSLLLEISSSFCKISDWLPSYKFMSLLSQYFVSDFHICSSKSSNTSFTLSSLTAILTHCFYWQVLLDIVWNWGDTKFGWLRHSLQTNPYPCLQNKFYWNHLLQIYLLLRICLPVLLHWLHSTPKVWNLISLPVGDVCVCVSYIFIWVWSS